MEEGFTLELLLQQGYRFGVHFDKPIPVLLTDEPPPLGGDEGPNPARLLAAAVANCLASSLLFAMRKFHNEVGHLRAVVALRMKRNEQQRLRIGHLAVSLHLEAPAAGLQQLQRILDQFEEFCVVTQSVRTAIPVDVQVFDGEGVLLKGSASPSAPGSPA